MSNQIAVSNTQALVGSFTQSELETLKGTIAKGTSNEQFALFVQTCASSGLNPFLNQIYCITYNGKDGPVMSIQIAVEGIVALAKKNPQYKGFIAAEVKEHDVFKAKYNSGEVDHEPGDLNNRGKTIGAYCVAYREGMPNVLVIITNDQVEHLLKGRNGQMWKDYYDDFIVKHAIKRAFKRQFGIEVAEDEHISSDDTPSTPAPYTRRDITTEADVVSQPKELTPPAAAQVNEMAQVRQKISTAFKTLGITDKEAQATYMQANCEVAGEKPTLQELTGLLNYMLMEIAEQAAGDDNLD